MNLNFSIVVFSDLIKTVLKGAVWHSSSKNKQANKQNQLVSQEVKSFCKWDKENGIKSFCKWDKGRDS